jgi:tetratricopeptide (TPR) repeat protein
MLAKKKSKKSFSGGAILVFALISVLAGCTPAGPRALLKGKAYLDRGDTADAISELKTATTLLATNANAWNYYGVALQRANQPDDAANAYKRALELDRDLVEVHFNLGSLWLEQNKPDLARTEFTAYTLRRNNDAAGWLKFGMAQLRVGEINQAERSFSAVLALKTNDPEAYNGLGLASIQAGVPRDAIKFFAAAVRFRPDYAAAILNLATVHQQYLHDNKAALENYQSYLALNPHPANWDEVNAIAMDLEKSETKMADATPVEKTTPPPPAPQPVPKNPVSNPPVSHPVYANSQEARHSAHSPPATRSVEREAYTPPPSVPVQSVQIGPESPIVAQPQTNPTVKVTTSETQPDTQPIEVPMPPPPEKPGFWHHLFGGSPKPTPANSKYLGSGLTPLPPGGDSSTVPPTTKTSELPPAKPVAVAPIFPHYNYYSPRKPAPGDHTVGSPAAGAFTKARLAETEEKWTEALEWYQQSATLDPSWFEAQYNTGVMAHRLHNYALALPRYEAALAIQPDSVDARYNFALALKAGGYPLDAANELKKILAATPSETRAHLALANICAQSLRDMDEARMHYQKVLELDPKCPQASDIRFWLSANQK